MSRIYPNVRVVTEEQRAARRAEEQKEREVQQATDEVVQYARSLAHDAYYAGNAPAPGVILVPAGKLNLSPRAAALAHGILDARVKTHLYRAVHAYVCLDCEWVGAFDSEDTDREAQRVEHVCNRARR